MDMVLSRCQLVLCPGSTRHMALATNFFMVQTLLFAAVIVAQSCPDSTYLFGAGCFPCSPCHKGMELDLRYKCNATHSVCTACPTGHFKSSLSAVDRCERCQNMAESQTCGEGMVFRPCSTKTSDGHCGRYYCDASQYEYNGDCYSCTTGASCLATEDLQELCTPYNNGRCGPRVIMDLRPQNTHPPATLVSQSPATESNTFSLPTSVSQNSTVGLDLANPSSQPSNTPSSAEVDPNTLSTTSNYSSKLAQALSLQGQSHSDMPLQWVVPLAVVCCLLALVVCIFVVVWKRQQQKKPQTLKPTIDEKDDCARRMASHNRVLSLRSLEEGGSSYEEMPTDRNLQPEDGVSDSYEGVAANTSSSTTSTSSITPDHVAPSDRTMESETNADLDLGSARRAGFYIEKDQTIDIRVNLKTTNCPEFPDVWDVGVKNVHLPVETLMRRPQRAVENPNPSGTEDLVLPRGHIPTAYKRSPSPA